MADTTLTRRDSAKKFDRQTGATHVFKLRRFQGYVLEVDDVHFHHDSAVMLPDYHAEPNPTATPDPAAAPPHDDGKITGLIVLRACYRHAEQNPEQKIIIPGHTDTTGQAGYNVTLSQMRADNVMHVLLGNRDKWVDIALAKHKVEDYQQILKWVFETYGWECDPGPIDNQLGPQTRNATKEFQKRYNLEFNASIAEDGSVGRETWGAFFDMYMRGLEDLLKTDAAGLAALRQKLKFLDDSRRAVGCGEHFPIEESRKDNYRSAINRRVEIIFFDPGEEPKIDCHPAPGSCKPALCELYNRLIYDFEHIPVDPVKPEQISVSAHLIEIAGLYQPGHHDPADVANKTTRRAGYKLGYKSDDDLGRIFINHIPRTDPKVDWDTITKKDKQFIELTVEIQPTTTAIPAGTRVVWEWEDPDDPSNEGAGVRDDAGLIIDPNDYTAGSKSAAKADDNIGKCDFPSSAANTVPQYEEMGAFKLTPLPGTKKCETLVVGHHSKVRLHCTNVGGDNYKVRVNLKPDPRLKPMVDDVTGIMTMWKRIDVEYRKMADAQDLPVDQVPPFFEKAFVQMDFTEPLPAAKKEFISPTEATFDRDSSRLVKKPPTGIFQHETKPGWFLLVAAHEATRDIGSKQSELLYEGSASLQELTYSGGEHGETVTLPVTFAQDVAFVLLDEGDKEISFSVWRKDDNSPAAGQTTLHLAPSDYQSDFVPGVGVNSGLIGEPGKGGAHDRTDNYYPGHMESLPAKTWVAGGYGFGSTVNLRVFSPGSLATGGVSPTNTFNGKDYFAGRTVIFTMHPAYFRFAGGGVKIEGTWVAGETVTVTINGTNVDYTTVAGDTPAKIVQALISRVNTHPTLNTQVNAFRRRSHVLGLRAKAKGPAGNSITLAASTTSSAGTATASGPTLTRGGIDNNGLLTTIVHEFGHAFGFPHKCGYHTFEEPATKSCAMNYFSTWLYEPGKRKIKRYDPGTEGQHMCGLHLDGIRKVHVEDNPAMWKF